MGRGTASWGAHGHVGGSGARAGSGRSRQTPGRGADAWAGRGSASGWRSALAQSLGHPGNGRGGRRARGRAGCPCGLGSRPEWRCWKGCRGSPELGSSRGLPDTVWSQGESALPFPGGGVTTSLAVTSPGDRELCPSPHPRTCSPSSPPSSHCSVTSTGAGSEGTWDGGRVRAGLIRGGRASESGGVKVEVQLPVGPGWVSEVPAPPHCWRPVSLGLGAPCK